MLMKSSDAKDAAKIEEKAKNARYELNKIYDEIIQCIEAGKAEIHIDFIRRWNMILEKYDMIVAQLQGIKDREDSIDSE